MSKLLIINAQTHVIASNSTYLDGTAISLYELEKYLGAIVIDLSAFHHGGKYLHVDGSGYGRKVTFIAIHPEVKRWAVVTSHDGLDCVSIAELQQIEETEDES